MTARPFADAVADYAQAGWPCVLPVPRKKSPPPNGFTGAEGRDTDPMQLVAWVGPHLPGCTLRGKDACDLHDRGDYSIALRMPDGVIGIDVDAYTKAGVAKHGAESLAAAVERWGELPASWSSTARGDGPSRIRFYRVPPARYATKLPGGDVEIIQRHHRYAVVWPSPHPDAGDIYRWYDPAGNAVDAPPKPGELPELPEAWVEGLREGATDAGPAAADAEAGQALLDQLVADDREPCAEITSAALQAADELGRVDAGSRHDTAIARTHQLVQLAASGHPGLARALPPLAEQWEALTAGEDRGEEWARMLLTSARKAVTATGPHQVGADPCTLIGSFTVPAPAPADDRPEDPEHPNEPLPEPIGAAHVVHPLEFIGTQLFDPRGGLDQPLAESVLGRVGPAYRYAYDSGTWLLRGDVKWEALPADQAEGIVSLLAKLMPVGNPDAEKGSDARDQADRRKKFMTGSTSSGIAKKIRAAVTGGFHPCDLKITDLDREPWLLWAGGMAYDLRRSVDGPTFALVDPATPHLHSAGVRPEVRPTPLWDAFAAAVWPDAELRAWALRVLAITFTGYADRALPILIGEQGRGKTQAIALLMSVLGSYAHAADPRLLGGADKAHASIVYALMGRRLSFIDEGPRDNRAGKESLKQLTGGGDLTGNQMNRNPVTFSPTHTLVLTSNDAPHLVDPAVRSRVRLIPCEGDPDEVRRTRAAIGHTSSTAWRAEAPGVLATMMREAAAWLAAPDSALTDAAPEAYRYRAEEIAADQDVVGSWLEECVTRDEAGTSATQLYANFSQHCADRGLEKRTAPSITKWGRDLTVRGYPAMHTKQGKRRPLRIRPIGGWDQANPVTGWGSGDGLVTGSQPNPSPSTTPGIRATESPETPPGDGLTGSDISLTHTRAHHTRMKPDYQTTPNPSLLISSIDSRPHSTGTTAGDGLQTEPVTAPAEPDEANLAPSEPESAKIARRLVAARDAAHAAERVEAETPPAKPRRSKLTPEEKAARAAERAESEAAAKRAELDQAIADAAGPTVPLPALVTRDGTVRHLELDQVDEIAAAFGLAGELTVDVETTGYPVGHADFALRTIQLGTENVAIDFDAADSDQRAAAGRLIEAAEILHAHSATADLIPLALAGVTDLERAWARMHDTVIPAKLADPASTGSDPGLKQLAGTVLGSLAVSPQADEARSSLFKTAKWLTNTTTATPVERCGWAQVDPSCETMIRYAASDVLDTAALARRLPPVPPDVLERERLAQRMTARVAHRGLTIDGAHVDELLDRHAAERAAAAGRVKAFDVANPGSGQQVAAALTRLGAALPTTGTGRPSVAEAVLSTLRHVDGRVGELAAAVLDYRHHDTAIGTFLEPYRELVVRGDGRARPTVYTLAADTGRMSCVRPNLQQVPREGSFRACITADAGQRLISADFAGVELRVAAALSGDSNLRRLIAEEDAGHGDGVHWAIARLAFGPEATKADRYAVKRGVFGRIYGGGIAAIARGVGVSETTAAAIVDALDAMLPELANWSAQLREAVKRGMTQFETYSGRVIHLPVRTPHAAPNYCIQGTAREVLVDTLVQWQRTRWGSATLLPVHDELVIAVPEDEADQATQALVECMTHELYGVTVKAEASHPSFAWQDAV